MTTRLGWPEAKILVVDDLEANVTLLERLLEQAGYENVLSTTDPRDALELFQEHEPDIVLLDLQMPYLDGFQVMAQLMAHTPAGRFLPILVLTAAVDEKTKRKALSLGAKDFLTKPFDAQEVLLRIKNLLETRSLHLQVIAHNDELEEKVKERTADLWSALQDLGAAEKTLRLSQEETIQRLAIAGEFRDDDTGHHVQRMSRYCALLASRMGEDSERCELIRLASQMHDVGKIGVSDSVLFKPGSLDPEERRLIELHPEIGYRILSGSNSELVGLAATIALTHHEWVDGSGYPNGREGSDIPLEGRLAAIADVFDALTNDRIYRPAFSLPRTLEIMREGRGRQFDAELFDLFLDSLDGMLTIGEAHGDPLSSSRSGYSRGKKKAS